MTLTHEDGGAVCRVAAGIAPVHRAADIDAEVVTHFHYGEEVETGGRESGFLRCVASRDGYAGFVCERLVSPCPQHLDLAFVTGHGAFVYPEPDIRSVPADFYPRRARISITGFVDGRGEKRFAQTPEGHYIPSPCLSAKAPSHPDIISAALEYLGVPYLWGGRSFRGIDCSGLVQNCCEEVGVAVPRDTSVQRDAIGDLISAFSWIGAIPGDLLYIPSHVMIYVGNEQVIHADGHSMRVVKEPLRAALACRNATTGDIKARRLNIVS